MERGNVEILPPFEFTDSEVDNNPGKGNNGNHNGNGNNRRRRRQAEDPLNDYDIVPTFDPPNVTDDQNATDNATKQCQEYFDSISVAQQCQNVTSDGAAVGNFSTSMAGCVDDILATNSTDYMAAALEALKTQCTAELAQNPALANSPIAADILAASCLNQCSGQGTCANGTCTCETGYTGLDCGFNLTAQPQYVEIYNNLCDVSKDDCSSAQVTGDGFIPNTTTCWVQVAKATEKGVVGSGDFVQTSLKFVSPNEVHCQLSQKTAAIVQVENSGTRSNSTEMVIYDSTCYNCVVMGTIIECTRKPTGNCIIDGSCYGPGQENPADKCLICRPDTSDSTWTHNSDSESCSSDDNIPLIVGLCVGLGGGLILIAIIVIIVVYKMRCADSKELMTSEEYETMSRGSVHRSSDFPYDNIYQSTPDSDVAGSIRGGKFRYRDPPPDYQQAKGETNETFAM